MGDGFDEAGLVAVADDEAGAGIGQIVRPALCVTPRGDDEGIRLPAAGTAYRAPGVGITGPGDRARVDDVDIRPLVEGDDLVTASLESGAEGLGLVLVQLAAEMLYGHAQRGSGLVRKAGRGRQGRAERPVAEGDGRETEKVVNLIKEEK